MIKINQQILINKDLYMHEKAFWQSIIDNKGALPEGESLDAMTDELLGFLRSPDAKLRDGFGYEILGHWILTGQYDSVKLQSFLNRWLSNLSEGLGETDTDSVLVRSFAALMLSILVYYDMKSPWIAPEDYARLLDTVTDYFGKEVDIRGFEPEKGWMHAIAHTGDVLKFLARDAKTDKAGLERILAAIANRIKLPQTVFTHSEEERISLAFLDVLKRQLLDEESLKTWLEGFSADATASKKTDFDVMDYYARQNSKNFLRALYFTLAKNKDVPSATNLEYVIYTLMKDY
jgi:hypothetical protein